MNEDLYKDSYTGRPGRSLLSPLPVHIAVQGKLATLTAHEIVLFHARPPGLPLQCKKCQAAYHFPRMRQCDAYVFVQAEDRWVMSCYCRQPAQHRGPCTINLFHVEPNVI